MNTENTTFNPRRLKVFRRKFSRETLEYSTITQHMLNLDTEAERFSLANIVNILWSAKCS